MFDDKQIEVYTTADGDTDEEGVWHDGANILIDTFDCDMQPYSSELLYKEYGYKDKVTKRAFLDFLDTRIKNGLMVKYNGVEYTIKRIIDWDDSRPVKKSIIAEKNPQL